MWAEQGAIFGGDNPEGRAGKGFSVASSFLKLVFATVCAMSTRKSTGVIKGSSWAELLCLAKLLTVFD